MRVFDTPAIQSAFSRAAQGYDDYAMLQRHVRAHGAALAKRHWENGAHILDMGTGTGALAREGVPWRITGLDLSPGMCGEAAKHMPVVNADAASMPFADASFGGVFSSLMLQWVNDPAAVFTETARVMKQGAHAVISTLAAGTLAELESSFREVDGASHVSRFAEPHSILSQAQSAGLALAEARQVPVTEHYPDVVALMRALQAIGASHKAAERRRSLMTPRQFARMECAYEKHRVPQGLPATWQVLYVVLQKT